MIRISKLTDYAILLMTHLARDPERPTMTARDLAAQSHLPLPTVGKLLKDLSRGELLHSERGINGGYRLARDAEKITVAEIIAILEGPIAVTECAGENHACEVERSCPVRSNWRKINEVVRQALSGLTLADMSRPGPRLRKPESLPVS